MGKSRSLLAFLPLPQPSLNAFGERVCQGGCASGGQVLRKENPRFPIVNLSAGARRLISSYH